MLIGMTTEQVQEACVDWAEGRGYTDVHNPEIKPDGTVHLHVTMPPPKAPVKRPRKAKENPTT